MKKDDCIFCKIANGEIPANALYEDDLVKVIFDLSPASEGHVLILPKSHYDDVYSLDDDTAAHIFKVAVKIANDRQYFIFICILYRDIQMIQLISNGFQEKFQKMKLRNLKIK